MQIALNVSAVLFGLFLLLLYFRSIVRGVLLNRRELDFVARLSGLCAVTIVHILAGDARNHERVERVQAWAMPLYIFFVVVTWFLLVQIAFTSIFYGTGVETRWAHAFVASGSSLSTLGFATPPGLLGQLLAVYEAGIGLAVVILLFTFVPGYQAAVEVRERRVGWLYSRTGQHPNAISLLEAQIKAGRLHDSEWNEWEAWFRGMLETHATAPILCHVPSIYRGTNWVAAAATVLDTTSCVMAALDPKHTDSARLCRETGVMTVRMVAAELSGDERVLTQESDAADDLAEFGRLYERLKDLGLPVKASQEQCREAFIRLRSEYRPSLRYISKTTLMPIEPPAVSRPKQDPDLKSSIA